MDGQLLLEVLEVLAEMLIRFLQVVHCAASVENGSVVLTATVQSMLANELFVIFFEYMAI